jgi:hypothetical protein
VGFFRKKQKAGATGNSVPLPSLPPGDRETLRYPFLARAPGGARQHGVPTAAVPNTRTRTMAGTETNAVESDILSENLWPGFDKFKAVQVRHSTGFWTDTTCDYAIFRSPTICPAHAESTRACLRAEHEHRLCECGPKRSSKRFILVPLQLTTTETNHRPTIERRLVLLTIPHLTDRCSQKPMLLPCVLP